MQKRVSELAEWLQGRCCPRSLPRDGRQWVREALFSLTPVVDQRAGRPGPQLVMRPVPKGSRSTLERELQLEELGAQRTTLP